MQFNRVAATKFFQPQAGNPGFVKLFIYSKNEVAASIIFDDGYLMNQTGWVFCLIKEDTNISDIQPKNLEKVFGAEGNTGCFVWLDSCKAVNDADYFNDRRRFISVINNRIINAILHPSRIDGNTSTFILSLDNLVDKLISFSGNTLQFSSVNDVTFSLNQSSLTLNALHVDLDPTSPVQGALQMGAVYDLNNQSAIPIQIAYLSKHFLDTDATQNLVSYDVFHPHDLDNVIFNGTYFPFEEITNSANEYHSKFDISKPDLKSSFVDDSGNHYTLHPNTPKVNLVLSRIGMDTDPRMDQMTLRPFGELLLQRPTKAKMLMGYSGTESITHDGPAIRLNFVDDNDLVVDETNLKTIPHTEKGKTTRISIMEKGTYNIDAQKAPLFKNVPPNDSNRKAIEPAQIETAYEAIPISHKSSTAPLPIIPTLAFNGSEHLVEFEKVFSKIRLAAHLASGAGVPAPKVLSREGKAVASTTTFITPQGFLRDGSTLDFIKSDKQINPTVSFRVDGVLLSSDFNISITKEDVFFVITPAMLQETETTSINFKIGDFSINQSLFQAGTKTDFTNSTIIIFKYSRHSINEMLLDTSKWSNYNNYRPNIADLAALQNAIKTRTSFPANDDYAYFNNTIKNDPNWNGVVVLNVPLGAGIPGIFNGLAATQQTDGKPAANPNPSTGDQKKLELSTVMRFQYLAFPVNRTSIKGGVIDIQTTPFYALIDYDVLNNPDGSVSADSTTVSSHFVDVVPMQDFTTPLFVLSKLLVRFESSQIKNFLSYAFIQVPQVFDNNVSFATSNLSNKPDQSGGVPKPNLIRLKGNYQKNSAGNDEFNFTAQSEVKITFQDGNILKDITVSRLSFTEQGDSQFRFDVDASADLASWSSNDFFPSTL